MKLLADLIDLFENSDLSFRLLTGHSFKEVQGLPKYKTFIDLLGADPLLELLDSTGIIMIFSCQGLVSSAQITNLIK